MWFYDTFLPSLFDRAGTNNQMWLTRKQTAICCQYMKKNAVSYKSENSYGENWKHLYYTCVWDGRDVTLQYSKVNGCGAISFSFNEAEKEESKRQWELNQKERKIADWEKEKTRETRWSARGRIVPEQYKLANIIRELENAILQETEELEEDIADGVSAEWINSSMEWIAEAKEHLAYLKK